MTDRFQQAFTSMGRESSDRPGEARLTFDQPVREAINSATDKIFSTGWTAPPENSNP